MHEYLAPELDWRYGTAMHVSAVVPAFNEAARVGAVVADVANYVDDVLVVDDASTDGTAAVAASSGARVVRQPRNLGYIAALRRGFAEVAGEVVVVIDGDGEFPASAVPVVLRPILEGRADMVQAARQTIPRPSERLLTWLANRAAPVGDTGTGMRALRTDLARRLTIPGRCICGTLALEAHALGARIVDVPVKLRRVGKPRRIAWQHLLQAQHVIKLMRRLKRQIDRRDPAGRHATRTGPSRRTRAPD